MDVRSIQTIIRDSSSSKYHVNYDGKTIETTVTNKAAIIKAWVDDIVIIYARNPKMVVGLDVEWRPHHNPSMSNKSATLQLCIDKKCLIIQLFYVDEIPMSLKWFLLNPRFTFVGVEVDEDILKLKNEYGLDCSRSADVRSETIKRWPYMYSRKPGLKHIARDVAGLYMEKPLHVCRSEWDARVLDEKQVEYACIDAYASYKIAYKLFLED
ncbi:unnamed protein product [Lactuca saligna]|uniref:3'-5' exonuclease domain-containing protein n=1 Tax=Lactuca saligna TaxID=75948 RepID=A0AA35YRJ0_LACSI|nr:unnamed protein product [Lactuca saligna]